MPRKVLIRKPAKKKAAKKTVPREPKPRFPTAFAGFVPKAQNFAVRLERPRVGLERLRAMVPLFDAPLSTFRKWKCVILADGEAYENTTVTYVDRDRDALRGVIRIEFSRMPFARLTKVGSMFIYDSEGRLVSEQFLGIQGTEGDILIPNYRLTT